MSNLYYDEYGYLWDKEGFQKACDAAAKANGDRVTRTIHNILENLYGRVAPHILYQHGIENSTIFAEIPTIPPGVQLSLWSGFSPSIFVPAHIFRSMAYNKDDLWNIRMSNYKEDELYYVMPIFHFERLLPLRFVINEHRNEAVPIDFNHDEDLSTRCFSNMYTFFVTGSVVYAQVWLNPKWYLRHRSGFENYSAVSTVELPPLSEVVHTPIHDIDYVLYMRSGSFYIKRKESNDERAISHRRRNS